MRSTTYPHADLSQDRARFGGVTMQSITKIILHTTETQGWPGYPSFAPQLTVDLVERETRQHMPLNKSASTLADPSSTAVRENRDDVLQIEMVGYCDPERRSSSKHIEKWSDDDYRYLASILLWVHQEWGTPLTCTVPFVAYPKSYGLRASQRLTGAQYDAYTGILGHQHASGNDHGDPGDIEIDLLLSLLGDAPPVDPVDPPPIIRPPVPVTQVRYPMPGGVITTAFGVPGAWMWGKHPGTDFNWPDEADDFGAKIVATGPGRVQSINDWGPDYGAHVIVALPNGRRAAFCHLSRTNVKIGQQVYAGTKIGEAGFSGNVRPPGRKGTHLHYEERKAPFRYQRVGRGVVCDAVKPIFPLALPTVSLSKVQAALKMGEAPGAGGAGANDGVQVQQALNHALELGLPVDGVLDRKWRAAAAAYQSILFDVRGWPAPGHSPDADGILGPASLRKLGFEILP